jgi:predicted dehydrogenase
MVEKPIATKVKEVEDMIKVCAKNNVLMMSAFVMRFIEAIRYVRKIIQEGELGKIDFVEGHLIMDAKKIDRDWMWDPDISGGGPVADLASHIIDLATFILNKNIQEIASITRPNYNDEHIERKAAISILFENDIIGNIYVSYDAFRESGLTFYGSEGKLLVCNFNRTDSTIQIQMTKNQKLKTIQVENKNYHSGMLDHFAEAILFGKELITPGIIGLENQKIIDSIYNFQK